MVKSMVDVAEAETVAEASVVDLATNAASLDIGNTIVQRKTMSRCRTLSPMRRSLLIRSSKKTRSLTFLT
jgi:hypothetical protein